VLLVPEGELVDDLPDLYRRLDPQTLAGGYLTLVSGPSRTADIEQTLVTGAHGPRRLTVVPVAGRSSFD
jgi:L-lactate dehydrogenase complex protein LldG